MSLEVSLPTIFVNLKDNARVQTNMFEAVLGQNGMDKMVGLWTKWYYFIFRVDFNSVEFNIYLVTKSHT